MKYRYRAVTLGLALASAYAPLAGATQFQTFSGYLSRTQSPFTSLANFTLEDFEGDLAFNVTGVTLSGGFNIARGGSLIDSVDADDGALDGSGNNGTSLYSGNAGSVVSFTFDRAILGFLPTHAGIVWTDVGNVTSGLTGFGSASFEAFDGNGVSLGSIAANVGDGAATGATAEDTFFGVLDAAGGISRITLTMSNSVDWEVDHLQFGVSPVPLPTAALLFCSALTSIGLGRRRLAA